MSERIELNKRNFSQNMNLLMLLAISSSITLLLISGNTTIASTGSPLQSTITQPQPPPQQQQPEQSLEVPQTNQVVPSPAQPPQIAWNELEDAEGFVANGKIDSTIYTINGNWNAAGNWSMDVADGELTAFNTTMIWRNGTAGHSHEFLNFETTDDVDIGAEDQTISIEGTMDVGTNGAVSWEDVPSEIVIQGGRIITISVDNEATEEHFSGQSVHGNLTSLRICSTSPGPAMQVFPGC